MVDDRLLARVKQRPLGTRLAAADQAVHGTAVLAGRIAARVVRASYAVLDQICLTRPRITRRRGEKE
jgi:hypothetical protein